MRYLYKLFLLCLLLSAATTMTACGKKGPLYLPEPAKAPAKAPNSPAKDN